MGNIQYTIISGATPITVELTPSSISPNIHNVLGTYNFIDVPNGTYNFIVTDSNNCIYEQELTVNPFITTTTTTLPQGDWMYVGQTDDINLIFVDNSTNRDDHYNGYPDPNTIDLYLWFKTLNGEPLITQKIINYSIIGNSGTTFTFIELSDQVHTELAENISGPSPIITGNIIFKQGFIETFFKYSYIKNTINPDYTIDLNAPQNWLLLDIPITGGTNQYGVTYVDNDNIILKF